MPFSCTCSRPTTKCPAVRGTAALTFGNARKLSASAFPLPLAQLSRSGAVATLWGQVRPGIGKQAYRVRYSRGGAWHWLGGTRATTARGFFTLKARLPQGTSVQLWARGSYGVPLRLR